MVPPPSVSFSRSGGENLPSHTRRSALGACPAFLSLLTDARGQDRPSSLCGPRLRLLWLRRVGRGMASLTFSAWPAASAVGTATPAVSGHGGD